MALTPQQLEDRRKYVGASEVSAILGKNPWMTPYDVWAGKTGRLKDLVENEAMEAGNLLEDGVLKWAIKSLGKLTFEPENIHKKVPLMSHADAITLLGEPVEAKTSGLKRGYVDENEWGDPGTDEIPDHVILQCQAHMACITPRPEICHVPTLLGGRLFEMFEVKRNDMIIDAIENEVGGFWDNYVLKDTPPEGSAPSIGAITRIRREPNKVITFGPEAVMIFAKYEKVKASRLEIEKDEKGLKAAVLAFMGDAEAARIGDTGEALTYFETTRNNKAREASVSTFRQLRHKKNGL